MTLKIFLVNIKVFKINMRNSQFYKLHMNISGMPKSFPKAVGMAKETI